MINRPCKGLLTASFLLLFGGQVLAAKIDLDNTSATSTTQFPSTTIHLDQFSRFSLNGPTVTTSFGSAVFPQVGPTKVSVFSLSDYGITPANIDQLGSLLQVRFFVTVCCRSDASASGQVSLFLIDPSNPTVKIDIGSKSVGTPFGSTSTVAIFTVSQFGALPLNITPDFYIGITGGVAVNGSGLSAGGSNLSILSTIPTPEPASMLLLLSGLAGSGAVLRWRRRSRPTSDANHPIE